MAQHTHGPWHYGFSTVEPLIEVYAYTDNKRSSVRLAEIPLTKGGKDNEWMEANARLIAAAPDLLDACKTILQAFMDGELEFTKKRHSASDPYHPANVKLVAAIAKAEGGA